MKKKYLFFFLLVSLSSLTYSQLKPSVYAGIGLGTNLGGTVGIGSEIKYKFISFNAAVGSWLGEFPEHTGDKSRLDYDFGIKVYPYKGLFLGVNYGLLGSALYSKQNQSLLHFEKTRGFSFTLGYKQSVYKNTFIMAYFGTTTNKMENTLNLGDNSGFLPRLGIILGYDFIK